VVVCGIERWVWKVVVVSQGGYGLWVAVAVDGGGSEEKGLFVDIVYVLFSANATYTAQYKGRMVT